MPLLTDDEKKQCIDRLQPCLLTLRAKMNVSQEEFGNLLGISRQTMSALETGTRRMSWQTFLAAMFIYEHYYDTWALVETLELPPKFLEKFRTPQDQRLRKCFIRKRRTQEKPKYRSKGNHVDM